MTKLLILAILSLALSVGAATTYDTCWSVASAGGTVSPALLTDSTTAVSHKLVFSAVPAPGYYLLNWTSKQGHITFLSGTSTAPVCTVTITANDTVKANFLVSSYRTVTFPASDFTDTIPNFVYYLNISDIDAGFTNNTRSDGMNIKIMHNSDTLKRQLVGYVQATPSGQFFFTSPASKNHNNVFYLLANSNASRANDPATWTTAGYFEVFHSEEASGTLADACANGSGYTAFATYGATGIMGNAIRMPSSSAYISVGAQPETYGAAHFSNSFWIKQTSQVESYIFIRPTSGVCYLASVYVTNTLLNSIIGLAWNHYDTLPVNIIGDGKYHNLAWVYDGTKASQDSILKVYLDGTLCGSHAYATIPTTIAADGNSLTYGYPGSTNNGYYDEMRTNSRSLTPAEIAANYNNIANHATFYSINSSPITMITNFGTYVVTQRATGDTGKVKISGSVANSVSGNTIQAEALNYNTQAVVKSWQRIDSTIKDTTYSGWISGIPTGGPYQINVRRCSLADSAIAIVPGKYFVGDLVLGFGQSNMEGVGNLQHNTRDTAQNDSSGAYDPNTMLWKKCSDPTEYAASCLVKVAEGYVKNFHVPVGVINNGHSSTSIVTTDPTTSWGVRSYAGSSVYGYAYWFTGLATQQQYKAHAAIWYQGESDAGTLDSLYKAKFDTLKNWLRSDYNFVPIFAVQIGRDNDLSPSADTQWAEFRMLQQRIFAEAGDPNTILSATAYPYPLVIDPVHLGWMGQDSIGKNISAAMASYFSGATYSYPSIQAIYKTGLNTFKVHFNAVLPANAPYSPFSMLKTGVAMTITGATISGADMTLTTTEDSSGSIQLRYMYGANPSVATIINAGGLPVTPWYGYATTQSSGGGGLVGTIIGIGIGIGFGAFGWSRRKK